MQYTVEQIRSVRNNFLEPPYPGFSLDEVCRKRRMAQTKLVRGENAWSAKGSAQTTDEWVQRLVQGSLNKMSERNYETLLARLRTKELFATREVLESVVAIIFQKAIDEPENSKLYAELCHNLARFEYSLKEPNSKCGPESELRDAMVSQAEREFKMRRPQETDEDKKLSDEEREFRRANFMRRKKANVRFVGELCLCRAMSYKQLFKIIEAIVGNMMQGGFPEPANVELFDELFRTAGIEIEKHNKAAVDGYFDKLATLIKRQDNPYPPRINFKIMDLLDYRKAAWGTKAKVVKAAHSASMSGSKKATSQGSAGPSSPTARKGKTEGTSAAGAWRAGPPKIEHEGTAKAGKGGRLAFATGVGGVVAVAPSASLASRAQDAKRPSPAGISPAPAPAPQRVVKFEARVHSLFQEWVSDCTNDFIPEWMDEFAACDREFSSAQELCVAVAMEVVKEACTTTRKDAQREACSFLIVGLFLEDNEMLSGLGGALASAMDDGLLEDVPKFPERFMQMVRLTSSEDEINADVYYDAANVLCLAYNQLGSVDEYTVDTLMGFWSRVPQQVPNCEEEERVVLNYPVIYTLCENPEAKPGLERLVSAIIHSLYEMNIVEQETVDELLTRVVESNPLYGQIVDEYKQRYGRGRK